MSHCALKQDLSTITREGENGMTIQARPLNVIVKQGTLAENTIYQRAGLPGGVVREPADIAPGIQPTPAFDLLFYGGKTIPHLTFTNFYVGDSQSWQPTDMQAIDHALAAALSDQHLNNVMMQYFHNQPISSTFVPSQILPGTAPAVVSQGDIEALVEHLYTQGKFASFDLTTTVLNFLLPSGTVLNTNAAPTTGTSGSQPQAAIRTNPVPIEDVVDSLHGLGGYHGSIHTSDKATLYYAVGVYSQTRSDGTANGIVVFDAPWKNVVATFYHELNEARTDVDVEDAIRAGNDPNAAKFLGWASQQGMECGDLPVFEANPLTLVFQEVPLADGSGTVPIQFMYSNAVHAPEGPIAEPHSSTTTAHT
jgi:hypothetical protein